MSNQSEIVCIVNVTFTDEKCIVTLSDDQEIVFNLRAYPKLYRITPEQRDDWELIDDSVGGAIWWNAIDDGLTLRALRGGYASQVPMASLNDLETADWHQKSRQVSEIQERLDEGLYDESEAMLRRYFPQQCEVHLRILRCGLSLIPC